MPSLSLRINLDPAGRIGPGKVDLHAVKQLINEFPELKSHIPAGIQAMLGGGAPGKKK